MHLTEAATGGVLKEKVFLEISQNSQENTCAQVFSCEFCKISKSTSFTEHLWVTASDLTRILPTLEELYG